jgi:uncharacterized membrane protein YfhO
MTQALQTIDKDLLAIKEMATQIPKIKTNKDYKKASDSVKFINDKYKLLESERKQLTEPFLKQKKAIDEQYGQYTKTLKTIIDEVKSKMLVYMRAKEEEQRQYEQAKLQQAEQDNQESIIVHDKVQKIKDSEFSSNTKKERVLFRLKDEQLRDCIEVKQMKLKEYLDNNPVPDFLEAYVEESIVVRTK